MVRERAFQGKKRSQSDDDCKSDFIASKCAYENNLKFCCLHLAWQPTCFTATCIVHTHTLHIRQMCGTSLQHMWYSLFLVGLRKISKFQNLKKKPHIRCLSLSPSLFSVALSFEPVFRHLFTLFYRIEWDRKTIR